MSVSQIINPITGKIENKYLDAGSASTLEDVLSNGNTAGPYDIIADSSTIRASELQTEQIALSAGSLQTEISVDNTLKFNTGSELKFENTPIITTLNTDVSGTLNIDKGILCTDGNIIASIGDVVSAYSSGMGPYALVSLNYIGKLINPLLNKLGVIPVANDLSSSTVYYDISAGGVGSPSSWIPDQQPPVDGSDNTWSHTKPAGAGGLGVKINWFPFNPYYPNPPSIGPLPSFNFTKKELKAVWAVITPLTNISTQGAIFFNIFTYDNVNGSSTYFTNRWDYSANNLALPLTTGALTLQAGFKYLIYCYDAPKIVATPSVSTTITQANGQYPSQTNADLMKDPFDIHTDIPHIGFSAVALTTSPTPQPSDPTNIPISGICFSTTSSQLTTALSFNVHSIGYRVIGGSANLDYEYNLQYD